MLSPNTTKERWTSTPPTVTTKVPSPSNTCSVVSPRLTPIVKASHHAHTRRTPPASCISSAPPCPAFQFIRFCSYNDEKLRIPAWCDRVLWRSWEGVELNHRLFTCVAVAPQCCCFCVGCDAVCVQLRRCHYHQRPLASACRIRLDVRPTPNFTTDLQSYTTAAACVCRLGYPNTSSMLTTCTYLSLSCPVFIAIQFVDCR
jgi:hypothetical protein